MDDDLDSRIAEADADYTRSAANAARDAERLVTLLTERIARRVRQPDAYPEATEVGVDSDYNLDVVCTATATLADSEFDPALEDVAELIRDDLLRIAETGFFHDDNRVIRFRPSPAA